MKRGFEWRGAVLLIAGIPEEHDEDVSAAHMLGIEEALLSFARAAFARGHRVIVPADRIAAPLLAMVAAEYRRGPLSESIDEEPPLLGVAVLGEGEDHPEQSLGPVLPDGIDAGGFSSFHELVAEADPSRAFLIGGSPSLGERVTVLRERGVPMHAIGPTLTPSSWEAGIGEWEASERILGEVEWPGATAEEPKREAPAAEALVPYPYLMQRLLELDDELGAPTESAEDRHAY
ncbi:MAG: hypothetical protein QOE75_1901 [Solirubrobacterales bacterium]|nr:hypothetical protein [Solirubrobacterales bacterium]